MMTNILVLAPDMHVQIVADAVGGEEGTTSSTNSTYGTGGEDDRNGSVSTKILKLVPFFSDHLAPDQTQQQQQQQQHQSIIHSVWSRLHSAIVAGFQSTCAYGPLMQEPLHGVVFSIDAIQVILELF